MIKVRINDIECREYKSTRVTDVLYEIIKWQPNSYYNKLQLYLDNGYIESIDGSMLERDNVGVSKSLFVNPESCYAISHLKLNIKEPDVYLESIGSRLLELTEDEQNDFFEVYTISNKKIYKKHFENE